MPPDTTRERMQVPWENIVFRKATPPKACSTYAKKSWDYFFCRYLPNHRNLLNTGHTRQRHPLYQVQTLLQGERNLHDSITRCNGLC